jgi:hypothetical protein
MSSVKSSRLARQTAERLIGSRAQLLKYNCLAGFDGFVDTIYHVIDQRQSSTKYSEFKTISHFGKRVVDAAGKSMNFEVEPLMQKIGGNGPIMAFAMSTLGAQMKYVGALGFPEPNPVFEEFVKRAEIYSIAEPSYTSAFEFSDGKLLFGQLESIDEINWENIKKHVGLPQFTNLWMKADFIAMTNWTMVTHMTAIWKKILSECYKGKKKGADEKRKLMFFDLADPAKRLDADLVQALKTIGEFQAYDNCMIGLNESEGLHVARVLKLKIPAKTPEGYAKLAKAIREKLEVHSVIIHPTKFAVGSDSEGEVMVEGPFTAAPKITTGAGDHFNAGVCVGKLLGLSLGHALQLGVATSGFYVRHAVSPNREQLVRFLQTL